MQPLKAYNFLVEYTCSIKMSEAVKDADVVVDGLEDVAILGIIGVAGFVVWKTRSFIKEAYGGVVTAAELLEDQLGLEDDPCRVTKEARENWWYGVINPFGSAVSAIRCKVGFTYYLEKDEDEKLLLDLQKPHWERIEKDAAIIAATTLAGWYLGRKTGTAGFALGLLGTALLVNDIKNEYQQIGNYDLSKDDIQIARGEEVIALNDLKAFIIEDIVNGDSDKLEEDAALMRDYLNSYRSLLNRPDIQKWIAENQYISRASASATDSKVPQLYTDYLATRKEKWLKGEVFIEYYAQKWFEEIYKEILRDDLSSIGTNWKMFYDSNNLP